jgi:hypothetical protein
VALHNNIKSDCVGSLCAWIFTRRLPDLQEHVGCFLYLYDFVCGCVQFVQRVSVDFNIKELCVSRRHEIRYCYSLNFHSVTLVDHSIFEICGLVGFFAGGGGGGGWGETQKCKILKFVVGYFGVQSVLTRRYLDCFMKSGRTSLITTEGKTRGSTVEPQGFSQPFIYATA